MLKNVRVQAVSLNNVAFIADYREEENEQSSLALTVEAPDLSEELEAGGDEGLTSAPKEVWEAKPPQHCKGNVIYLV